MTMKSMTVQLLDWSEGKRGRKVVFEIMDDPENPMDQHPFKDVTSKNGKVAGQLFAMVVVELDEQGEEPKEPLPELKLPVPPTGSVKEWDSYKHSQKAAILCKQPEYWRFVGVRSEGEARDGMCRGAGIKSRSEFDTNNMARGWLDETLNTFSVWCMKEHRAIIGGQPHGGGL